MRDDRTRSVLDSGMIQLSNAAIDRLPEGPALYRLRTSGQRIVYIGHAGDEGLRQAIRDVWSGNAMTGVATVEYSPADSADAAAAAAGEEIDVHRPLYNEGYGRFRNSDIDLPKQGHRIRKAMDNP